MAKVPHLGLLYAAAVATGGGKPTARGGATSIPGPMPNFGPFATIEDAIFAACSFIMSQPHAVIPVRRNDLNFDLYWRLSNEYCAWGYAATSGTIDMSMLAVSGTQDNQRKRKCPLPAYVSDSRTPGRKPNRMQEVRRARRRRFPRWAPES